MRAGIGFGVQRWLGGMEVVVNPNRPGVAVHCVHGPQLR